jgi:hypothetical protein
MYFTTLQYLRLYDGVIGNHLEGSSYSGTIPVGKRVKPQSEQPMSQHRSERGTFQIQV